MSVLRVGTRGSELALWQTGWVCDLLLKAHPKLDIQRVIIKTHGDVATEQKFDADWPAGGFVSAIEQAMLRREIDLAVHSFKDVPTAATPGLVIAAIPCREVAHDVLVTRAPVDLGNIPPGFRLGTSSPRRAAQFRRHAPITLVPIRGNVPTRVRKVEEGAIDGVVLAAAGLKRLQLHPRHRIDLPMDRFVPSPAQGALAVQTRADDPARATAATLDHAESRLAVEAERQFLKVIGAGCHVPLGAHALIDAGTIRLHGQLFTDDFSRVVEGTEVGRDPTEMGERLAKRLQAELNCSS
ncbi:MAG: hydroxymethylbilane synthase [Planctomycetota bacterium]